MAKSEIQAVLFNKRYYNSDSARRWLKEHNYKPIKPVHVTKSLLRYRIREPKQFDRFVIKTITPTIKLVIGYKFD